MICTKYLQLYIRRCKRRVLIGLYEFAIKYNLTREWRH